MEKPGLYREKDERFTVTEKTVGIDIRKIQDFGIGTYIRNLLRVLSDPCNASGITYQLFTDAHCSLPPNIVSHSHFSRADLPANRRSPFQGKLPHSNLLSLFHAPHYLAPDCRPAPLVLTVHDCIHLAPPKIPATNPRFGSLLSRTHTSAKRLYHRCLSSCRFTRLVQSATAIISVSKTTAEHLIRLVPVKPESLSVVYNCLDDVFFEDADESCTRAFCQQHELPFRDYVLYCGNDLYHKNLPALLTAWKRIRDTIRPPLLVLAGPPRPERIREYAEMIGIASGIKLLGRIPSDRMPCLYRGAVCLVFPSLAEGFGLPVIEAMISGTPVLCSDLDVLREITGGHACFFDPADPAGISDGLSHVLSGAHNTGHQVLLAQQYARKYSLSAFASGHMHVYTRVLEAGL